jgi:hypothetical protein
VPASLKDYRIVSKDPGKRNLVIRIRVYFGQVVVDRTGFFDRAAIANVTLKHGAGGDARSGTRHDLFSGGSTDLFDGNVQFSVSGTVSGTDLDGFGASWNVVAHEFGHALGLIDDYGEGLSPSKIDKSLGDMPPPAVLSYDQKPEETTDYRPFYSDLFSIMNFNCIPRMRHYWHHVEALNREPAFAGLPGAPFLLRHETFAGGLEFVRPIDASVHPWVTQFADKPIPGGFGKCTLFPVGQDEGTADAMMRLPGGPAVPLPPGDRVDGILVIRSRVRFRFSNVNAAASRDMIWQKFDGELFDGSQLRKAPRFVFIGGTTLQRIAVFIEPLFDVNAAPFTSDDFELLVSDAAPKPVPPNPFDAGKVGDTVSIDVSHFAMPTVMRAILGVPTSAGKPPAANKAPLTPADFTAVASVLDGELHDGKHVAAPM